jgi:alpha-2-macroglobulin family protein
MRGSIAFPLALAAACAAKRDRAEPGAGAPEPTTVASETDQVVARDRPERPEPQAALAADDKDAVLSRGLVAGSRAPARTAPAAPPAGGAAAKVPEGPTRSWFPETFLFEPLVVTDDHGAAVVPVRVPDRLTTWRVLALAHSRTGAQGGAVTSFLGTLPTYVDPVVPPFLIQGDEVRVPIQVVNTTSAEIAGALEVSATGATLRRAPAGRLRVPAQGSALDHAALSADHPGRVTLRVALAGGDAVERSFEVRPAGRPVTESRSGTLAAPRSFQTAGTPGADPATDRVHLLVFPGALALLRSELAASAGRGEPALAGAAYALLLAAQAPALLTALGDRPDPAALRELAIVAGQRAIRDARTLDVDRATLLAEPAALHAGNPVLARLGARAAVFLARAQRPDGTFAGGDGWTLQRVLIATADATRAITAAQAAPGAQTQVADRQRAQQIQARAAGAFARTAHQVTDGYTAAAILASGTITGELAAALRGRVEAAIRTAGDGAKYLELADGVVRADGAVPSRIEATALAVLALETAAKPALADLGTTLLGGYTVARGWGDGRVNLVAMRAVLALFRDPVPSAVTVTLAMDGQPIVHGTLDGGKLRDVLALDGAAPGLAAPHRFTLTAEPAVPGLGFALELDSWLAWGQPAAGAGLELVVPARIEAAAGAPIPVAISAVAPSGIALHIHQALPAGVQVDAPSLEAQVASGAIQRFTASDGALDVDVPPLAPGATFALTYRAIATLAGTLHTGASRIDAGADRFAVPPATWIIK